MFDKIALFTLKRVIPACVWVLITYYKIRYRKGLAKRLVRDEELQALHDASLRYRIAIGRNVSFRHRDGRSWQCRIVDVVPRAAGDVRLLLEEPEGVFDGLPILFFDAGLHWWEVWLQGDEDITTVEVRFDWEDEWRADSMPSLPRTENQVASYT